MVVITGWWVSVYGVAPEICKCICIYIYIYMNPTFCWFLYEQPHLFT